MSLRMRRVGEEEEEAAAEEEEEEAEAEALELALGRAPTAQICPYPAHSVWRLVQLTTSRSSQPSMISATSRGPGVARLPRGTFWRQRTTGRVHTFFGIVLARERLLSAGWTPGVLTTGGAEVGSGGIVPGHVALARLHSLFTERSRLVQCE